MLRIEYIGFEATADRYEAGGDDMFQKSNWIMS
jgi:hypothetical protein